VLEEARRLASLESQLMRDAGAVRRLEEAIALLATHVGEREALLGRGRGAAAMAPQELLAAATQLRRPLARPLDLRVEDAVTHEGTDYLVRAVLTYFAGGRTWRSYQLRDGGQERWLEVRAAGADVAWYEPRPDLETLAAGAGETLEAGGRMFRQVEAGTATVDLESAAGRRDGIFVEYRRYAAGNRGDDGGAERLVLERWPDGLRVLAGRQVAPEDFRLWTRPAASQ
jgi:hypothetical protein